MYESTCNVLEEMKITVHDVIKKKHKKTLNSIYANKYFWYFFLI